MEERSPAQSWHPAGRSAVDADRHRTSAFGGTTFERAGPVFGSSSGGGGLAIVKRGDGESNEEKQLQHPVSPASQTCLRQTPGSSHCGPASTHDRHPPGLPLWEDRLLVAASQQGFKIRYAKGVVLKLHEKSRVEEIT
jgi:hypothetical protein